MRTKTKRALSDAMVQQIYDRTGGVPLFVEEFTTMVQESALPDQEDGSSRGQTLLAHEIPATLQDLVMARLDRIQGEREFAQLAATLGREFSYEVLSAVADLDEWTLQRELAELVQAEILYPKGRPPRCSYIFKHALLEDALYNALVKGKRQRFHRRIADVLEAQFPQTAETRPELLAHHFSEAGLAEKGAAYWLKAGLRSRERSAEVEAISHLTKGLTLVGALAESPERDAKELQFLSALAPCHIAVRGYAAPQVGPILERARELCERAGQAPQLFGTMLGTWEWRLVRGDIRQCVDLADEGMRLADRLADPGILMEALFMPGVTMFYRAEFFAARQYFERALATYDDRERTKFWSTFTGHNASVTHRCYLALALWQLGYADQAMKTGSRDAPARPHNRARVHHRSRPGFHSVSVPVLSTRQRSRGSRRGRDRDRHGSGVSALARARDASQGRGIAAARPPRRRATAPSRWLEGVSWHRRRTTCSVLSQHAGRGVYPGRALRRGVRSADRSAGSRRQERRSLPRGGASPPQGRTAPRRDCRSGR